MLKEKRKNKKGDPVFHPPKVKKKTLGDKIMCDEVKKEKKNQPETTSPSRKGNKSTILILSRKKLSDFGLRAKISNHKNT